MYSLRPEKIDGYDVVDVSEIRVRNTGFVDSLVHCMGPVLPGRMRVQRHKGRQGPIRRRPVGQKDPRAIYSSERSKESQET